MVSGRATADHMVSGRATADHGLMVSGRATADHGLMSGRATADHGLMVSGRATAGKWCNPTVASLLAQRSPHRSQNFTPGFRSIV